MALCLIQVVRKHLRLRTINVLETKFHQFSHLYNKRLPSGPLSISHIRRSPDIQLAVLPHFCCLIYFSLPLEYAPNSVHRTLENDLFLAFFRLEFHRLSHCRWRGSENDCEYLRHWLLLRPRNSKAIRNEQAIIEQIEQLYGFIVQRFLFPGVSMENIE